MLVVPAIDIRGGKCVRLLRGDYAQETVFGDDPAAMARRWVQAGARALHLVDLDGARAGRSLNDDAVAAVLHETAAARGAGFLVELGGGIRDVEAVARWLAAGVDRVILGTVAVTHPEVVARAAQAWPGRVWVGIDARAGRVAVSGWLEGTGADAVELARDAAARGAAGIIYTDIERDGTRAGVNVEATARLAAAVSVPVYASGGVGSAADIRRLREAGGAAEGGGGARPIAGVIVGRALYDGSVTLAELLAAAAEDR